MAMATSRDAFLYLAILTFLPSAIALSLPLVVVPVSQAVNGDGAASQPFLQIHHHRSVHSARSPSTSSPDGGPPAIEIGLGIGVACVCCLASLVGLYYYWRRPRHQPLSYRKHVRISSRLRQAFSSAVLRFRRPAAHSYHRDMSLDRSWLSHPQRTRPHRLQSRANSISRTWRLPGSSQQPAVPLLLTKEVSGLGIAELSSSPMVGYAKEIEAPPTQTFLLPPSPTHTVPYSVLGPAYQEMCVSRFSATTVDASSLGIPASRMSMVTTTSTTSSGSKLDTAGHTLRFPVANELHQIRRKAVCASVATFVTSSTGNTLVGPATKSHLRLASEATLIRTPERAARLVSLRRMRFDGACKILAEQEYQDQQVEFAEEGIVQLEKESGTQVYDNTKIEYSQEVVEGATEIKNEYEQETKDEDANYRGWGHQSRWISRSVSLPAVQHNACREGLTSNAKFPLHRKSGSNV